jgi:hypothetical protein
MPQRLHDAGDAVAEYSRKLMMYLLAPSYGVNQVSLALPNPSAMWDAFIYGGFKNIAKDANFASQIRRHEVATHSLSPYLAVLRGPGPRDPRWHESELALTLIHTLQRFCPENAHPRRRCVTHAQRAGLAVAVSFEELLAPFVADRLWKTLLAESADGSLFAASAACDLAEEYGVVVAARRRAISADG